MIDLITSFLPHILGALALVGTVLGMRVKWKRDGARDERAKQEKADNDRAREIDDRAARSDLPDRLRKWEGRGYRD